ncbi:hypothetical protein EC973_002852 [Apophysomyces ossiformis]|uniref:Uncharacterized protein n=1 Tax=Apophysomyces ossiformis TaxID=679940 RepID=A0A8H7BM53_9FUNG|nr:hypothetical protein EC973_002852 [Apophysomyces ossiformis]
MGRGGEKTADETEFQTGYARVQTEVVKQKEEEKEEEREGEATKLSDSEETKEIEDEMLARMEEQLQNLIQEGQAALSSIPEIEDMDEKEMAMRHAFSKRYST